MEVKDTAALFKCLGDETRLRILMLLKESDSYVELLSSRLDLTPGTLSHHLKKLEAHGFVKCSRSQFYVIYSLNTDGPAREILSNVLAVLPEADEGISDDERYRRRVLSAFIRDGRLTLIPSQLKKREIVYRHMLESVAVGQVLCEKEINALIEKWYEDYCTVRRDFISCGLMTRENGVYTRIR